MTKRTRKTQSKSQHAELDFESAMAQLEDIVESIESGEVGLERSLAEYEKGVQLIARCRSILENAEQRVEALRQSAQSDAGPGGRGSRGS